MQFDFASGAGYSGYLAFTPRVAAADRSDLLLVVEHGHDAVHMIDVVSRAHIGYVAAPGTIAGPRGVAASGDLVAVSGWKNWEGGDHLVHIYRAGTGGGSHWTKMRVIGGGIGGLDGQVQQPIGLRFSEDGSTICVADYVNGRVSLFRVSDGEFVRHIATELDGPRDVEVIEGGWMVACWGSDAVEFVCDGGRPFLGRTDGGSGSVDGEFYGPAALAVVPGLGLVVRQWGRLQVASTLDILAMRAMSDVRVGWMTATYRAIVHRHLGSMR